MGEWRMQQLLRRNLVGTTHLYQLHIRCQGLHSHACRKLAASGPLGLQLLQQASGTLRGALPPLQLLRKLCLRLGLHTLCGWVARKRISC